MKLLDYLTKFSDEQQCKEYYRDIRIKEGVNAKSAVVRSYYWLKAKWQFQCSECGFRTTLVAEQSWKNPDCLLKHGLASCFL